MPRKVEIIVEAQLDGYVVELGMTRELYETAHLSFVNHPRKRGQIDHSRKAVCIQARKALQRQGRANAWVDFDKISLRITREVDKPITETVEETAEPAGSLTLFDSIMPTDPYCGCAG